MKRNIALLLALVLILGIAAGCTTRQQPAETPAPTATPAPTPTPTAKPTPTPTPEPTATPEPTPEPEPPYRNPFNGEPMETAWTDRPFAVMINNLKEAQPQCGISKADIIYEVLAEGGVTRMMAIFSDIHKAEHLGSIRSIRPYYIDISLSYGAVTCHAGGSEDAYSRIRKEKIQNLDGVRGSYPITVFYRDQTRRYSGYAIEHTLFTEGRYLYECAEKLDYPLTVGEDYDTGLRFARDAAIANGQSAQTINVFFNGNENGKCTKLVYHEDTGLYTAVQSMPGKVKMDYIDGNTQADLTFRNVLYLAANSKVLDGYGRLRVDLIGEGTGYHACDGVYEEITWKRESLEDCFHYYLADGSEVQLCPGTTYIGVLSQGNTATIQSVIHFE